MWQQGTTVLHRPTAGSSAARGMVGCSAPGCAATARPAPRSATGHCASATSNCRPDAPRDRLVIGPTAVSSSPITSSRSTSSASTTTPANPVNEPFGAPRRTRFRLPARPRTLLTRKGPSRSAQPWPQEPRLCWWEGTFCVRHADQPAATSRSGTERCYVGPSGATTPAWVSQPSQSPRCQTSSIWPSRQWRMRLPEAVVWRPVAGTGRSGVSPLNVPSQCHR